MFHYVYKIEHITTGEFYIGSRSSKVHPSLDNYLGSPKTWKPDSTKLIKKILGENFSSRREALKFESDEIKKVIKHKLNRNYHIPDKGFCTIGRVTVRDKEGRFYSVLVSDPKYLSGEYVHARTGVPSKFAVVDKEGNRFAVFKNDVRFLSGELIALTKGFKHTKEVREKMKTINSIGRSGIDNSQYDTMWICNLDKKKNKKIKKGENIPSGWIPGKRQKNWIN
jgi:hypothetical protein